VVIEQRLDGTLWVRLRAHYLSFREASRGEEVEFSASPADARSNQEPEAKPGRDPGGESRPAGMPPTVGRSGRTPAEPYPPYGKTADTPTGPRRPAKNHPWRKPFKPLT
jgi:hypothetical protein